MADFDFPEVTESLDVVPEAYRTFYKPKGEGEGFAIADGLKSLLDEKATLRKTIENERKMTKAERAKAKAWEELGKAPDEIKELLTERERREAEKAEKDGNWETLKKQMLDQHLKELEKERKEKDTLLGALKQNLVNATAANAIATVGGIPQLLMPHIESHVKVVQEDGQYQVRVLDAKGEPRINANGDFLTIKDLVEEMRNDQIFSRCFNGSGMSGSGSSGNTGGGSSNQKKALKDMTAADKAAFISANGLEAWQELLRPKK